MNESSPLISIIIPAYNIEKYISDTLDSVFRQTYENIEVIVVDDGSKDETGNILDFYARKEPRLKVIHKKNGGVTSARICGVENSKGEYIGFIDGDDLIDPDMYERLYGNIKKYGADISHCGYKRIQNNSISYFYNTGKIICQDNFQGKYDLLEGSLIEPGLCNKLFRRSLFGDLLSKKTVMDFSLKENEDLLMNYCLFGKSSKSVFEDFCPYHYLIRSDSSSHSSLKPHILSDPIKIGELLIGDTKESKELNYIASRYYTVKLIFAATVKSKDKRIIEAKKEAQKKLKLFISTYVSMEKNKKRKFLAVFAAYFPALYGTVHNILR